MNSVACNDTGDQCSAVGLYNTGVQYRPLSYISTDAGTTWSESAKLPPPVTGGSETNRLDAVACSSNGLICTSVGSYNNSTGSPRYTRSLSYTSSDGGNIWTVSTTLPPDIFSAENAVSSVACSADGQGCTAVGGYRVNLGGGAFVYKPLTYVSTNAGVTWAGSSTQPTYLGSSTSVLNSISCDSTGLKCVTVGYYNDTVVVPLSYYSNNGGNTWSVSTTLPPPQGSVQDELQSVKCDERMLSCIAVGRYFNGSRYVPISYTSSDEGNTWGCLHVATGSGYFSS